MPATLDPTAVLTVAEAAESRRSIRRYEPEPIPREDLEEILRLTGLAPSAFNAQPWRWIVVETPELKARLQDAANGQAQVGNAPASCRPCRRPCRAPRARPTGRDPHPPRRRATRW